MYRDVDTICRGDDVKREIFQEHLNPDRLAGNLSLALSKKTGSTSGHIHIHFCGKSDHIVIVWSNGRLRRIAAKSPRCEKGRCLRWKYSQFCDYEKQEVLENLYDEIERIEIDEEGFSKTWVSYDELISWLIENGRTAN